MNVSNLVNIKQRIYLTGWEVKRKRESEKKSKILLICLLNKMRDQSYIC